MQCFEFSEYSYCDDDCCISQTKTGKFCLIVCGAELYAENHSKNYMNTHLSNYSVSAYPTSKFVGHDTFLE